MLTILPPTAAASLDSAVQRAGDEQRLLTISAAGFDAAVTCAVGERRGDTTYLAYLSLLGPGTTVVAIWANLMDHHRHVVTIDGGVGLVQLWQRQPELANLGYHIAWRRRHKILHVAQGPRMVHLVTEPDLLTGRDPLLAETAIRSQAVKSKGVAKGNRKHAGAEGDTDGTRLGGGRSGIAEIRDPTGRISPASSGQGSHSSEHNEAVEAQAQFDEQVAREKRPIFVLLARHGDDAHMLACRHLLFLAERIQWLAYYEPWADALWQRGLETSEIVPLSLWPAAARGAGASSSGGIDAPATPLASDDLYVAAESMRAPAQVAHALTDHTGGWITSAYLCRPEPFALAAALPTIVMTRAADGVGV